MGKQKRPRQKLHLPATNKNKEKTDSTETPLEAFHPSPLLRIGDDLFKGLDINVDNLNTNFLEDDRRSIKSFKSVKSELGDSKIMPKKEKLKLRRELFLRKIGVHQQKKDNRSRLKGSGDVSSEETNPLNDALPSLKSLMETTSTANRKSVVAQPRKAKGIQKAGKRKKDMVKDVKLYKKVLSDKKFKANCMAVVSEHIRVVCQQK